MQKSKLKTKIRKFLLNTKYLPVGRQGKIRNTSSWGFTLVELIIYMGLLSILLSVLMMVFGTILDARLESEATSTVEQDGRFILSRLMYDIHRANSITIPTLGNSANNLQIVIDGVTYSYAINGVNLELTNTSGTDMLNSSETIMSGLTFQQIGNPSGKNTIKVSYTVTSRAQAQKGVEARTIQTVIGIR